MYPKIINKIIELGEVLPAISGHTEDIEKVEKGLTGKEIETDIETKLADMINTFPGKHYIYAEELHSTFIKNDNVWIIDPISNTVNFICGMPHYSIVLSHLCKGEVQFAVVYDPSNKELFTAEKGKGTFLNNKRVYAYNRKEDPLFMIGPYITLPHRARLLKVIEVMSEQGNIMRNLGSLGVHYAYVACGRANVAISFNEDTFPEFAGKLLVEEAGGKFTDFAGDVLNIKTRGVIASNGLVHHQIKNLINGIA